MILVSMLDLSRRKKDMTTGIAIIGGFLGEGKTTQMNSTDMYVSSITITYIFREGNVLAFIQFQKDFDPDDEVFEPRYDWTDQIVKEQAECIHGENVFPWL